MKTPQQPITEQDKKVIVLLCQELTNKEIAAKMFLSLSAIEGTLERIREKHSLKAK